MPGCDHEPACCIYYLHARGQRVQTYDASVISDDICFCSTNLPALMFPTKMFRNSPNGVQPIHTIATSLAIVVVVIFSVMRFFVYGIFGGENR